MGLKEAIIRISLGNEITKICTDSLSSVMAVLDPHTPHQLIRDIQSLLRIEPTQNRNILVRWIKAHLTIGVVKKPILSPKTITEGVVVKALKPQCEIKSNIYKN
ncbi:hypothetical protein AVEN_103184-1 [Araneus ventricosus]|uniref:RNase H type-1 domain-containing protein n=1 Tax=Araneus ventricosus TaxID=182803 RepID=A0A4Y2FUL6_ARAVE|nr:hypothetical protein AVEN_103184-1 [Araneus ventricosus]